MRLGERRDSAVTEKEHTCRGLGRGTKIRPVWAEESKMGKARKSGTSPGWRGGQDLEATGLSRHDKNLRLCSMCFGKP